MTLFYNRKKVTSSHLLSFSKKPNAKSMRYFDFNTDSWLNVTAVDYLPYNMIVLQTDLSSDDVIVCSIDSYRLYKDNLPSVDFLYEEREWREKILNEPEYIFEYKHSKQGWIKAVVENFKDDIIDRGVISIEPRLLATSLENYHANNNVSLDVLHYESKRLAKEGTNTEFYTQEQLQEEKKWIENYTTVQNNEEEKIKALVRRLKNVTKRYVLYKKGIKVYDLSDTYKSLTRDPKPITFERMIEESRKKSGDPDEKGLREFSLYDIAPIGRDISYDIFWHHEVGRKVLKGSRNCGICNIVTSEDAKLVINGLELDIPKTSFENPLILLGSLSNIEFKTEGEIEYDILEFEPELEKALRRMNYNDNYYICTLEDSVYLGSTCGGYFINHDDITVLPPETEEEMLESEKKYSDFMKEVSKWKRMI